MPRRTQMPPWSPHSEAVMISRAGYGQPKLAMAGRAPHMASLARTATIGLYVKDIERAVAGVNAVARRGGGDVLSLEDHRSTEKENHPSARMDVRVPDSSFSDTLSRLETIGVVRTQTISAEDLTSQIIDSSARLRNLRRTESDMLKIMDRSGSVGQVMDAENQLSQVREQIETLDSETKAMVQRVRYSTITVSMEAEVASAPLAPAGVAQLTSAWMASTAALTQFTLGVITAVIWMLTFAPYALAVALAAWFVRRKLRWVPK